MIVAVAGSSAPLSLSVVCLGLFLYLRLYLLYLCIYLVYQLFCCFVYDCAWVVCSSICVCYVSGSVPRLHLRLLCLCLCLICRLLYYFSCGCMLGLSTLLSMSAICLGLFFCLCPRLLCICAYAWFVYSSVYVYFVCGCAKSVKKRANQFSISRFTR